MCYTKRRKAVEATKEELMALGVRYAVGASHWRVDLPKAIRDEQNLNACIREFYK